jgi:probable phosphoglycerate mutase
VSTLTRVYFVRHAEAEGNLYRICEGRYDGLLSPRGREQLPCVTEYFRSVTLDAVYSSPLHRAVQTANAVAAASGLAVLPCPELCEIDFGYYEGMPWGNINLRWPDEQRIFYNEFLKFHAPGGESAVDAVERIWGAVQDIARRHTGGAVAVVGHSAAFGAFLAAMSGGSEHIMYMQNAAVTVAETDGERFNILSFNERAHLDTLAPQPARRSSIEFAYRPPDLPADEQFIRFCGEDAWRAVYGNLHMF